MKYNVYIFNEHGRCIDRRRSCTAPTKDRFVKQYEKEYQVKVEEVNENT